MTKEEAINKLNEIQNKVYSHTLTKFDRSEFHRIQREVLAPIGFSAGHKKICGKYVWFLKDNSNKQARRDARFECKWINKDMSPNHKHLIGNCTTRAMAYVLFGSMTYDEIEREQYRLASIYNTRRNSRGTWERVLINRGWVRVKMHTAIRADRLASMTQYIECPIVTVSSAHASVIDRGSVVDSWDSRGKKVVEILIKKEFQDRVNNLGIISNNIWKV